MARRARQIKERKQRYVYVLGRPLTIADKFNLSFLSEGKLHLCHWAMLVTSLNLNQISEQLPRFDEVDRRRTKLGTLFELVRHIQDNEWQMIEDFGSLDELQTDWKVMSIAYVGKTRYSNEAIEAKGIMTF